MTNTNSERLVTNTNSERLVYHATDIIRFAFIQLEQKLRGTKNSKYRPSGAPDPVWYNARDIMDPTSTCMGSFRHGIPAVILGIPTSMTMPYSVENLKTHFGWTDEDVDVLLNKSLTKVADTSNWRISHDIDMNNPQISHAWIDPRTNTIGDDYITIKQIDDDTVEVHVADLAYEGRRTRQDGRVGYAIKSLRGAPIKSNPYNIEPHLSRQQRRALERRQAKGK